MGCTSSREARLKHHHRHHRGLAPYIRSQSMPIHEMGSSRRIIQSKHHNNELDDPFSDNEAMMKCSNDANVNKPIKRSEKIDREVPRTPTKTPSREPETINTWELMEGLEEAIILDKARNMNAMRSKSFGNVNASPKPIWMQIEPDDSIVSEFDPDIISNFRKALDEEESTKFEDKHDTCSSLDEEPKLEGIVKTRIQDFQRRIDEKRNKKWKCPPNGERKVVLYTTSLRGIRKTYEDCWGVKVILQGYCVKVDERDVSMHMGYKEEVDEILGQNYGGYRLPRVFANGKYVGGAEEVNHMHEVGELVKVLAECERIVVGKGGGVCERCGDVRFVPCENCSGSCKIFVEDGEEEEEEGGGGFRRCPDCNENGLVRCSLCL